MNYILQKAIDMLHGGVTSPLPNTPMQNSVNNMEGDLGQAFNFSPAGQLVHSTVGAINRTQPDSWYQAQQIPGALRVASTMMMPGAVATGAAINGAVNAIGNTIQGQNPNTNIIPSAIEGGRTAAALAPVMPAAQMVNAPMLREVSNRILPTLKEQTLLESIINNLKH